MAELGVAVSPRGWPVYVASVPEQFLAGSRERYGQDWAPLPGPVRSDDWSALDADLEVDGIVVGGRSKMFFMLLDRNLVGTVVKGTGIQGFSEDGDPQYSEVEGRSRIPIFDWPYDQIAGIEVERRRKYMKMWDSQLIVEGTSRASLSAGIVSKYGSLKASGSGMVAFAHALASAVNNVRQTVTPWSVKHQGGTESHRILFGPRAG